MSRMLIDHMKFFEVTCQDVVERHIPHEFSKQMSMKSNVVSLIICTCIYHEINTIIILCLIAFQYIGASRSHSQK